jgi:hypothetical protein
MRLGLLAAALQHAHHIIVAATQNASALTL